MPLPREVIEWRERAEIDHVGPFVKAWAAFNAWYRYVSGTNKDADSIRHICAHPNPVRNAVLPYLDPMTIDTAESTAFKGDLASLHAALEGFRLEVRHKGRLEHVSFRSVPIGQPKSLPQDVVHNSITYRVEKGASQWITTVLNRAGHEQLRISQSEHNLTDLQGIPGFSRLPPAQAAQLRALYKDCDPRPMVDLLSGSEPPIMASTISFRATCQDVFAGTIQTIYRMRNMLLHGELAPDPQALAGFEHAFHLLRRMLRECR